MFYLDDVTQMEMKKKLFGRKCKLVDSDII